jgi:hypothetical protein
MPAADRAVQFSPFAALTGFDGAIKETARLTDQRMELDADERALLNEKLRIVREQLDSQNEMEFTFYKPDEMKAGGAYVSLRGIVKKIDENEHVVVMQDGTWISVEEIVAITGEMFRGMNDFAKRYDTPLKVFWKQHQLTNNARPIL